MSWFNQLCEPCAPPTPAPVPAAAWQHSTGAASPSLGHLSHVARWNHAAEGLGCKIATHRNQVPVNGALVPNQWLWFHTFPSGESLYLTETKHDFHSEPGCAVTKPGEIQQ